MQRLSFDKNFLIMSCRTKLFASVSSWIDIYRKSNDVCMFAAILLALAVTYSDDAPSAIMASSANPINELLPCIRLHLPQQLMLTTCEHEFCIWKKIKLFDPLTSSSAIKLFYSHFKKTKYHENHSEFYFN